jgi:peptide deformylase
MAILKVARMGHPVLREVAQPVGENEFGTGELLRFVEDMFDTMGEYVGIGLAAPQVHVSKQIAIVGTDEQNIWVVCNPIVTVLDQDVQGFWEGCLSVPGLRGFVERPKKIRVEFRDPQGAHHQIEPEGFLATVFQHEIDHLNGVVYVDRVKRGEHGLLLGFQEEFDRFQANSEELV